MTSKKILKKLISKVVLLILFNSFAFQVNALDIAIDPNLTGEARRAAEAQANQMTQEWEAQMYGQPQAMVGQATPEEEAWLRQRSQQAQPALVPVQASPQNIAAIQQILNMPSIVQQIEALYGMLQQATNQRYDTETQKAFAQALVHVFNNARTTQGYMIQLINAAQQTPLLDAAQQAYVTNNMVPAISGAQATAVAQPTPVGVGSPAYHTSPVPTQAPEAQPVPQAGPAIPVVPSAAGTFVPGGDLPLTKAKKKRRKKKKRTKRKKKTKKKRKKKKTKKRKKTTKKKKGTKKKAKKKKRKKKKKARKKRRRKKRKAQVTQAPVA